MESLQMIQIFTPAYAMVSVLVLPWCAAALMHAVSSASDVAVDDKWKLHAQAAVRWSGAVARSARDGATTTQILSAISLRAA